MQELFGQSDDAKKAILDVRAKLSDGTKINIEVQNSKYGYSDKRCLMYWSRLYTDYIKSGMEYDELQKFRESAKIKKTLLYELTLSNFY